MCLLALFFRVVDDAPVVVGANREEHYARGGEPPRLLDGPIPAVAGIDPAAGGTWLGINGHGLLAAVTNRAKANAPVHPPSRGLLVRELLGCANVRAATDHAVRALGSGGYAGCNLLLADRSAATVVHAGDWLRVRPLPPGLHVLTSQDVNDASDRRLGHALWWLEQRRYTTSEQCLDALKLLCAQTGNPDPPICLHGADRGTVSSTLVALKPNLLHSRYLHAQGPPDRTSYEDCSSLLKSMVERFR
jgi:uncharacterized protein with NRDE domain